MMPSLEQKDRFVAWIEDLQGRIIKAFEGLEDEGGHLDPPAGRFQLTPWKREHLGGGGTMAIMRGRVFEKVGVNVSIVNGQFSEEFRHLMKGADEDPNFWAAGISLVAHMASPRVPAIHMNFRHIVTQKSWFGGGMDLTPYVSFEEDTAFFHKALKQACASHDAGYYATYKKACDTYFFLKHRNEPRGVGGLFIDDHNTGDWEKDFAFIHDVGETFLEAYVPLVKKRALEAWGEEERRAQLIKRGRYVEFNLLYDRGTQFGLQTGGNTDAILMSMPPEVLWP